MKYAEFRKYLELRQGANNSIMALLAGSKLAAHTLQLTTGSERLLSEIFPQVEHIDRFDLRTDSAQRILSDAELHLSTMAIPYVLAIHEDYLMHCCGLAVEAGVLSRTKYRDVKARSMHETLAIAVGMSFSAESLELFHIVRSMRNSQIHEGGFANQELVDAVTAASATATSLWTKLARPNVFSISLGSRIVFGHQELVGSLAVTHRLAVEANEMLQVAYPTGKWAGRLVADAVEQLPPLTGNPNQKIRKLKAFGRRFYDGANVSDPELENAVRLEGLIP